MTTAKKPADFEVVAWESTAICYTKFVSDRRYQQFSPKVQAWYKPYRCSSCESLQSSLLAKEAECEALREDAERLDFLQSWGATVEILPDGSWRKFRIGGRHSAQSPSVRAAIDAARAAADQGGA